MSSSLGRQRHPGWLKLTREDTNCYMTYHSCVRATMVQDQQVVFPRRSALTSTGWCFPRHNTWQPRAPRARADHEAADEAQGSDSFYARH